MPNLQRTFGDQAVQQSNAEEFTGGSTSLASSRFAHDFSRIPAISPSPVQLQPKLEISTPGDRYEQEADRVAEEVMRMSDSAIQVQRKCACGAYHLSISHDLMKGR
jgi:hypothetical protein